MNKKTIKNTLQSIYNSLPYRGVGGVLGVLFGGLLFASCTSDNDVFDTSAAERRQGNIDAVKSELVAGSAANGWVMQYFVAGTSDAQYPGFNVLASFNADGSVLMASDHSFLRSGKAGTYTEASSIFNMSLEDGPILSFNTWNDVFSVLSDPVNPTKAPNIIQNDGAGMSGDNNLVVISHSANEMLFRGERYSARSRMIPCDRPWQQYLDDVKALKTAITSDNIGSWYMTDGKDTLEATGIGTGVMVLGDKQTEMVNRQRLPLVFTPKGIRLERQRQFGESAYQEFEVADDKSLLLSENKEIALIPAWDKYVISDELWMIDNSTLTAEQTAACNSIEALVKAKYPQFSLRCVALGKSKGKDSVNGLVLVFYKNSSHLSCISAGIAMDKSRTKLGYMSQQYTDNAATDYNMSLLYTSAPGIQPYVAQLAKSFNGTYLLAPDDFFNPSTVTFTADDGHQYEATKTTGRIVVE